MLKALAVFWQESLQIFQEFPTRPKVPPKPRFDEARASSTAQGQISDNQYNKRETLHTMNSAPKPNLNKQPLKGIMKKTLTPNQDKSSAGKSASNTSELANNFYLTSIWVTANLPLKRNEAIITLWAFCFGGMCKAKLNMRTKSEPVGVWRLTWIKYIKYWDLHTARLGERNVFLPCINNFFPPIVHHTLPWLSFVINADLQKERQHLSGTQPIGELSFSECSNNIKTHGTHSNETQDHM